MKRIAILIIVSIITSVLFIRCKKNNLTVTDIDGNTYETIKICDQIWIAENLKVTHYRNGDIIQNVKEKLKWKNLNDGAYSWYDNDESNVDIYGLLYNWHAVDDSSGLTPIGWHVPTEEEWQKLEQCLGMSKSNVVKRSWRGINQGDKIKENGLKHWQGDNVKATNESGFTALPGGFRDHSSNFYRKRSHATFWSATELENSNKAWGRELYSGYSTLGRGYWSKRKGFSVRCIKD